MSGYQSAGDGSRPSQDLQNGLENPETVAANRFYELIERDGAGLAEPHKSASRPASPPEGARDDQHLSILADMLAMQERIREQIARELHDGIGQSLNYLLFGLQALAETAGAPETKNQVTQLRRTVETIVDDVRRIARGLRPNLLDEFGLVAAVDRHIADFMDVTNIHVEFRPAQPACRCRSSSSEFLSKQVEMAVFRIIQEALSNVARHAGAQRVAVCLECRPACIVATVSDDGCGFDLANRSGPAGLPVHADFAAAHFGLSIMNERARLFSGELTVDSRPSEGTTVRVSIPLSEGMTADDHGLNR